MHVRDITTLCVCFNDRLTADLSAFAPWTLYKIEFNFWYSMYTSVSYTYHTLVSVTNLKCINIQLTEMCQSVMFRIAS